jgi:ABC-2 type transport system ATP-binding protein
MDFTNLDFGYRSAEKILNGLSLQLVPGEKHGILGVNGAGKTTLFRLLSGQMKPNAGTITHQDLPLRREQVSFLEAEPYFYPYMTGMEYLRFINDQPDQIERWNSLFDLPLPHYAEEYSTGMKKKLGLIGVLLQENRPLLILDEPFNGVDFESNEIIMSVLKQNYTSTRTVLISSHILPTLTRICQRISVLQNGCINRTYEQSEFRELEKMVQIDVDLKVSEALR